jgi:hypothetical protein
MLIAEMVLTILNHVTVQKKETVTEREDNDVHMRRKLLSSKEFRDRIAYLTLFFCVIFLYLSTIM